MRRAFAVLALVSALWALAVSLSGGLTGSFAGLRISSTDVMRPLIIAIVAALAYAALSGISRVGEDLARLRRVVSPVHVAAALTAATLVVAVANNSWGAGGSDSYSYASQMDLWLHGTLKVPITMADQVPWPNALATFTPFGYSAVAGEKAIAPITGAGLPLLMAGAKSIGGQAAAFLVVPTLAAVMVWTTFLLGRRVGSELIGVGAGGLVATSPTFLMMSKSLMSDVPAAAFWTLATYWTLGPDTQSAVLAGLAASIAILVRPNLAPLAVILAIGPLVGSYRSGGVRRAAIILAATLPGCFAVAAINQSLFGSPMSSGYGNVSSLFSLESVPTNFTNYLGWLVETQTPVALSGVSVLLFAPFLGAMLITVWALYVSYLTFDAWWFLRFLLPSWPAMFIGTTAAVRWMFETRLKRGRALTIVALLALGGYGILTARQRGVFPGGEGERRYATVAELVAQHTEPSAMILSSIHSGSIRYYAGRATLRFDLLDGAWLDRSVEWLRANGRHPYLVIEDWEMASFRERFDEQNAIGALRLAPALAYRAYRIPGTVYLFDLLDADARTITPAPIRDPKPRSPPPAVQPVF